MRERLDVSGMIRALEGYLAATRPPEPPAPPRQKTETEAKLEKLLEDLSKPLPPAPEPVKVEEAPALESVADRAVDVQLEPEGILPHDELAPIVMQDLPAEDDAVIPERLVAAEAEATGDEAPAPPPAAPIIRPEQKSSTELLRRSSVDSLDVPPAQPRRPIRTWLLGAALLLAIAPLLGKRRSENLAGKAVLSRPAAPLPVEKTAPLPSDPQARALALVLAFRPSGGPVTAGEIFRSIAGNPIPDENWEIRPTSEGRFVIRFVPYRGALGENYSYEFNVDARANWARPRPDTALRLRADAIGRLAARSNLEALRQFLDLGR